jgi:diguanylate cyclase (GGDEF)-like protein
MLEILIAEDNPVVQRLICTRLQKWGYKFACVSNGADALQALRKKDAPKMVLLDWIMPGLDGVEVCRSIRKEKADSYTYVILFTANDGEANLVEAMDAGADDFISKSASQNELRARIRAGMRILALEEKLLSVQEKLHTKATHDHLTGLLNHAAILDHVEVEFERAKRKGLFFSIAMVDLDHFKKVNDKNGHLAGDRVLCEAAKRISRSVRVYDAVGRYGGEEFMIVMPDCEKNAAVRVAERIRESMCEKPCPLSGSIVPLTVSIGVASVHFKNLEPQLEDLIHTADLALYEAKKRGRNCVVAARNIEEYFSSTMGVG